MVFQVNKLAVLTLAVVSRRNYLGKFLFAREVTGD